MKNLLFASLALVSLIVLSGCPDKGEFEKAGERTDEIVDNVKDGDPILHEKGPLEKAGEKVDDTVKDAVE